jgi:autotransporter-associated beta strand protein
LSATSGELVTDSEPELIVRAAATFLPAGSGAWHLASNWDANAVPNSASASVIIPPNTAANRDVTNNAPTTVASVTFELGSSAFRSRINGTTGQPFTLASTSGISAVTVSGTGAGHANIEVAGGLILSNETLLDVQSIGSTNAEYGALRLQGSVSGPGPMVKRGPGMAGITGAGKTFSGDITIEQGVLTFSEPAITANNVTNYTVQPGGQLRLSSAGNPRNYLFKGPLHLAGDGRAGVPDNENLGVRGALRLEAGGTGTLAVLTNTINLTASADVHVPAGNAMQLGGPLTTSTNTNVLAKSGGGTLVLSSNASAFTGGLAVNRGVLRFDAAMLTNTVRPLVLTNETVLTGTGRWGGSLEARDGSALAFFPGLSPGDAAPLRAGSFAASGAVTIAVTPAGGALAGTYPLLAVDGAATGLGHLSLSLATTNFPAARLSFRDGTLYAVLSANEAPAEVWLAQYGLPTDGTGEGADNADPDGDGVVNLVERALFLNPRVAEPGGWAVASGPAGEVFAVTYRVARNQNDLSVRAESSPSLGADAEWTPLVPEVADDTHPDYTVYRAALPQSGVSGFVRLKVTR